MWRAVGLLRDVDGTAPAVRCGGIIRAGHDPLRGDLAGGQPDPAVLSQFGRRVWQRGRQLDNSGHHQVPMAIGYLNRRGIPDARMAA